MPWPQVQGCDSLLQVLPAYTVELERLIDAVLLQRPDTAAAAADPLLMAPAVAAAAVACASHDVQLLICHASENALPIFSLSHAQTCCQDQCCKNNGILAHAAG